MLRKLIAAITAALISVVVLITPAAADIRNLQESPKDVFTMEGTPSNFDALTVAYAEFADSPDFHFFFIDTDAAIKSNQFNDDLGSWAMIRIDIDGDNTEDFRIEAGDANLERNFTSPANVWDTKRNTEVQGCSAGFYSDLGANVSWLGFRVPFNCLKLPKSFGIQGYTDYIADDGKAYDYVPDSGFFRVTHQLVPPAPIATLAPPSLITETLFRASTPGAAPADLVALSPEILKSVVTVFCGQGLGTGWAAKVAIPASVTQRGMRTFLVTNHHVVEDCISTGEVTVTDVSGNSAVGLISSFDAKNDLAGIYTRLELPTLSFRGERPTQGWLAGVLGSPRGLEGYLTTGLVSKVAQDGSEFGVSASLNPGNSGGPIFDREGRVLGVATYKISDSEGLGFARSTPLLCQSVISCSPTNSVWLSNLSARPGQVVAPTPIAAVRTKVSTLPAFAARSSRLNSNQQNSINRQLVLNDWVKKFICTGVIATNATVAERSLARTRAKAACDFALRRDPSLATFFQTKASTSKSSIGRVLLTLRD